MLNCTRPVESQNHIVKTLSEFNPTTVSDTIAELRRDRYIREEQWRAQHSALHLLLTDRGIAAAILLGAHKGEYRKLNSYRKIRKTNPFSSDFYTFERMTTKSKGKDFLIREYCRFLITNDCFDKSGNEMTSKIQKMELLNTIGEEVAIKWGRPGITPQEFVQVLVEEFGADQTFVVQELSKIGILAAPLRSAEQSDKEKSLRQEANAGKKNDATDTIAKK